MPYVFENDHMVVAFLIFDQKRKGSPPRAPQLLLSAVIYLNIRYHCFARVFIICDPHLF